MTEEQITKIIDAFVALLPYLSGAVIGLIGGLVGTRYAHGLKSKSSVNVLKRERLEQLVSHLIEISVWLDKDKDHYLWGGPEQITTSPLAKAESIAALLFVEIEDELTDLRGCPNLSSMDA